MHVIEFFMLTFFFLSLSHHQLHNCSHLLSQAAAQSRLKQAHILAQSISPHHCLCLTFLFALLRYLAPRYSVVQLSSSELVAKLTVFYRTLERLRSFRNFFDPFEKIILLHFRELTTSEIGNASSKKNLRVKFIFVS